MENRKECHPELRAVVVNRRMENMEQFLRVGVISSTHGIRGEVKVYPTTDDPERFLDLDEVILDTGREHKILEIEGVKFFKNQVILKFKGYDNINDIEKYLKKDLLVDREHAVELGENENFIADLIDMEVVTDEGKVLGTLTDVIETGANDVYAVKTPEGKEILLPAIRDCILDVNKHNRVDDYPYGGGAGMVMQAEPVYLAWESVVEKLGRKPKVLYMSPQGRVFDQTMAQELAEEEDLLFLCGHYEGIDERVLEEIVDEEVSIGDYVLTGGELPALVIMDAVSRLVGGVLHNEDSAEFDSFHDNLLEYPQYSRPEVWRGKAVPLILMSGHHANVEKWRREQSLLRTRQWRPDLLEDANLSKTDLKFLRMLEEHDKFE